MVAFQSEFEAWFESLAFNGEKNCAADCQGEIGFKRRHYRESGKNRYKPESPPATDVSQTAAPTPTPPAAARAGYRRSRE